MIIKKLIFRTKFEYLKNNKGKIIKGIINFNLKLFPFGE